MKLITGEYCMPCKIVKNYITDNNIQGVEFVDAEANPDIVKKYDVKQTPTLILDDDTVIASCSNIIEYFEGEE